MNAHDFYSNSERFHLVAQEVPDTGRFDDRFGDYPRYDVFRELASGDIYEVYRRANEWRKAPGSAVTPMGLWQRLS